MSQSAAKKPAARLPTLASLTASSAATPKFKPNMAAAGKRKVEDGKEGASGEKTKRPRSFTPNVRGARGRGGRGGGGRGAANVIQTSGGAFSAGVQKTLSSRPSTSSTSAAPSKSNWRRPLEDDSDEEDRKDVKFAEVEDEVCAEYVRRQLATSIIDDHDEAEMDLAVQPVSLPSNSGAEGNRSLRQSIASGRYIHVQLPTVLGNLYGESSSDNQQQQHCLSKLIEQTQRGSPIGSLQILESGAVRLRLENGVTLKLESAVPTSFRQDFVAIDSETLSVLGPVNERAQAVIDV